MADKTIGELKRATSLDDDSLLIAEQQGEAVSVTGKLIGDFARESAAADVQRAVDAADAAESAAQGVNTYADAAAQSATDAENARQAIENMIVEAITKASGEPPTVSKELVNGVVKLVFGLPAGDKGDKGDPGNSIQSIERTNGTGASGTTDTYTITLTDGSTTVFYVYNGKDGMGAGDMTASVYDPDGAVASEGGISSYVDGKISAIPTPDVSGQISAHNTDTAAHADIRAAIEAISTPDVSGQIQEHNTDTAAHADIRAELATKINQNLLHNWYFANPVNQRGKYVVPPGTIWYLTESDLLNGSAGGTLSDYRNVVARTATYITFLDANGNTLYAKPNVAVCVYSDTGYTIDRWSNWPSTEPVLLTSDGIVLSISDSGSLSMLAQTIEHPDILAGQKVTLSVLTDSGLVTKTYDVPTGVSYDLDPAESGDLLMNLSRDTSVVHNLQYRLYSIVPGSRITVYAAKLELGSTQTLAHQDENGNWILNEIPDYEEELAKCQRYYQRPYGWYAPLVTSDHYIVFKVPLGGRMRTAATASNVTLDATKMFIYDLDIVEGFTFAVHVGTVDYLLLRADKTSHGLPAGSAFLIAHDGGIIADADL